MARFAPIVNLTKDEDSQARLLVEQYGAGRPVIWTQTKTSTDHKDWTPEGWAALEKAFPDYTFVDLAKTNFPPRISAAFTNHCAAGVVLDSFLLHGSQAVGASNVLALMMASQAEVVCYPWQKVLKRNEAGLQAETVIQTLGSMLEESQQYRATHRQSGLRALQIVFRQPSAPGFV